jgi:hypothetical protein
MAEPEAATDDDRPSDSTVNERLLDALVYVPAGLALTVVEELPRLAARGRERLGVRVSSARAVGQFAVKAGHDEFLRRSEGWFPRSGARRASDAGPATAGSTGPADPTGPGAGDIGSPQEAPMAPPTTAAAGGAPTSVGEGPGPATEGAPSVGRGNGHVPTVTTLSIPGFDALSASQVVQRLDGLNRSELVSVRAYEASNRGRRTILSRVDQLLDERS